MDSYSLTHLADGALLQRLRTLIARDRATTAEILAHLAEVDERRLYAPAGYPSMFTYCLGELHLSEDGAWKRIQAARAARRFPVLFDRIAGGRLHLAAIVLLSPHLTRENSAALIDAAENRSKREIERLLAERFPQPDLPCRVEVLSSGRTQPAPGPVGAIRLPSDEPAPGQAGEIRLPSDEPAPGQVGAIRLLSDEPAPGQVGATSPVSLATSERGPSVSVQPPQQHASTPFATPARVAPLAPERFALQFTVDRETYEKLRHVQELLGHATPSTDLAGTFDRALDALARELDKRKFAATDRPRPASSGTDPRHVPAAVRRAVWERDAARCTFVNEAGRRCEARAGLEFDHVVPVARGGEATEANVRLRCRAHNQLAADDAFGAGYMSRKRPSTA